MRLSPHCHGIHSTHSVSRPRVLSNLAVQRPPAVAGLLAGVSADRELAPVRLETARTQPLDDITAAVVDVALDPSTGIEVCAELHRRRPDVPLTALVCCPRA